MQEVEVIETWPEYLNLSTADRRTWLALKGQRFLNQMAEEVKTFLKSAVSKEWQK
jgi:hypothetical protein